MMDQNDFLKLIEKITNGTASDEDIQAYQDYYNSLQQNKSVFATKEDKMAIKTGIWQNISQNISGKKILFRKTIYWAAAVAILIGITFASIQFYKKNVGLVYVEKINKNGQRSNIMLPDGSEVWLNGESALKYPKAFKGSAREVYLEGEAYFKVKHSRDTTFIVHAGNLITKDIGTAFNIKAYPGENKVTVTVVDGCVQVDNNKGRLGLLKENEQLSYRKNEHKTSIATVDAGKVLAWIEGRLIFDGESFEDVVADIKRTYNINIKLNDNIRHCSVYAAVTASNLEENIRLIAETLNATVKRTATGYVIVGGRCS